MSNNDKWPQLHKADVMRMREVFVLKLKQVNAARPSMFKMLAFAKWEAEVKELQCAISAIDNLYARSA